MAAREGQGLQIAVIIFAMLTIILAITTYIFYAQSQTAAKERDDAVARARSADAQKNKFLYKVLAYQYVMNMGGVTKDQVDAAKAGAGGDDQEVTELLANFQADMDLIGSHAAEGQVKNYRTMPAILLAAINKKNSSVVDANDQTAKLQADKAAAEAREQARANEAVAASEKANADLAKERETYVSEKARITTLLTEQTARIDAIAKKADEDKKVVESERDKFKDIADDSRTTIEGLKEAKANLEREQTNLFESPDGKIVSVNQRQQMVLINVGRADGLMRQTTFSVFDHDINGVANAKPKASLEVVSLTGDHMAECRIVKDINSNPIIPGDVIHTPTWSPGQKVHFVLAGFMDIDGDGRDDQERVHDLITLNGGVVDAVIKADGTREGALTFNTRYMVRSESDANRTAKAQEEINKLDEEIKQFSTEVITVNKLLTQMGWKADTRTRTMSGGSGTGFRSRRPGTKAGAPADSAPAPAGATEPMPATEAAPATDPFGGAAPAADPFGGAPAASPMPATPMPAAPAAEVDPFGGTP